jgi:hypothetical protein
MSRGLYNFLNKQTPSLSDTNRLAAGPKVIWFRPIRIPTGILNQLIPNSGICENSRGLIALSAAHSAQNDIWALERRLLSRAWY